MIDEFKESNLGIQIPNDWKSQAIRRLVTTYDDYQGINTLQ